MKSDYFSESISRQIEFSKKKESPIKYIFHFTEYSLCDTANVLTKHRCPEKKILLNLHNIHKCVKWMC